MLRIVKSVMCQQHMTSIELCGEPPKITTVITKQRTKFSGQFWKNWNNSTIHQEITSLGIFGWKNTRNKPSRNKPFIGQLEDDMGNLKLTLSSNNGKHVMLERSCHDNPIYFNPVR